MSYEIVKEESGRVIAGNGCDFFICGRYSDGTFHRKINESRGDGIHSVESRDLQYIAIGAPKLQTLDAAEKAFQ